MKATLGIDDTHFLADGFPSGGIGADAPSRSDCLALSPRLDALRGRIQRWRSGAEPAFLGLAFARNTESIAHRGHEIAHRFRQTIVLGIGGSSLGGEMLVRVLGHGAHHVAFYDNLDPTTLFDPEAIDWEQTLLLVVSKSGNTVETLGQFLTVLPDLEARLGPRLAQHVLVVTENANGALHKLASELKLDILAHPPVGGRFSVLSVVGLLPAAISGVDIAQLMQGARAMAERVCETDMAHNPAFLQGAAQYLHAQRGRRLSAQFVYADRLLPVTRWFAQLWGESLGKRDASGVHQGLTPLAARGATDQHSQLQLYLDGPDDKQFTFLVNPALKHLGARVPESASKFDAVRPLAGHTLGEMFYAEFEATRAALARRGRPARTFTLAFEPYALGELIVLLETETVVVAELLGIDPFDQPAVEDGKKLAWEYLKN
jgi:glucose-6-phosphate isomerase